MFKNEFQGCNFIELFNSSNKDPLASFRVLGSNGIQKIFDRDLKESIFQLDGSPASTKLSTPKEIKSSLSLIQRCIVFQVNIKENHDFSLDIGITDLSQNKRNLHFSTSIKDLMIQPLSAKIPIKSINRLQWINLIFDLTTLINDIWKNQTLKSIESFSLCANCKVRKVFTINKLPSNQPDLISEEPIGPCVDFPRTTDSITQVFSLNDVKPDLIKTRSEISSEQKSKNVFKIAFGTKLPSAGSGESKKKTVLKPIQQTSNQQDEASAATTLDPIEKNNLISPISTQNPGLPLRRKSESENQQSQPDKKQLQNGENIHVSKITTWNQRAVKSSLPSTNMESISTDQSANTSRLTSLLSDMSIQSTKIPHPPPQSTRPSNSSARKLRLTSAVKSNKPNNSKQPTNVNSSSTKLNLPSTTGDVSSNEEDIHNNSSKTLIDYSPFKNKAKLANTTNSTANSSSTSGIGGSESLSDLVQALKLKNGVKKSRQMQLMSNNDESATTASSAIATTRQSSSVYSFSSRPKPAGLNQRKDAFNESLNASSSGKIYDFRKYSSNIKPIQKNEIQTNLLQSNDNFTLSSKRKLTQPFKNTTNNQSNNDPTDILKPLNVNTNTISIKKNISHEFFDSIDNKKSINNASTIENAANLSNNNNDININLAQNLNVNETYNEVIDSFEAQMLRDMKAEMDEPKLGEKKENNNKDINNNRKISLNPKSPDAEYFEIIQQDSACGFHSPFSDDNNHTTSEKYNFDAITSSIDETSTSLSKKTPSRNARGVDSNNYQEEMDVSLQLNLPSKSINLKDLQLNYSPLQNHPHHTSYMLQKNPITEEPSHYDDSQADIDEIVSDSEEEVDLLYDPSLNCYYDPKTSTYYELNLS